jgi:HEAT repeat protein
MLEDRSARVRAAAAVWYARRIHPAAPVHPFNATTTPAAAVGPGVELLLKRLEDENFNVRLRAVMSLGAYVKSNDLRVAQALQKALDDPKHKVHHAAARLLRVPCRGCRRTWQR